MTCALSWSGCPTRARRGRWYSLTAILLVCACAAVSGARSTDEIAEWAARALDTVLTAVGVRRHPLRWRRSPSRTTIGRVLAVVDGGALDQAVGAYLTGLNTAVTGSEKRQVIAVDGKSEAVVFPGVIDGFSLVLDRCGGPVGVVACQIVAPREAANAVGCRTTGTARACCSASGRRAA
ncbi:transposase family protein [Streptomyces tendae]